MTRIFLTLFIGLFAHVASAEIYKCTNAEGALVFSDRQCGTDAEAVVIKNTTSGISITTEGDFSKVDEGIRARDVSRSIDRRYQAIASLQSQRDAKLADLRHQQSLANNNLAGATYLQSIAAEMQAVTDDYNARIALESDAIRDLSDR